MNADQVKPIKTASRKAAKSQRKNQAINLGLELLSLCLIRFFSVNQPPIAFELVAKPLFGRR
ncbi:MAG: hypothetical protein RQ722_13190 [Desulfuromonadales bacterium]|nr:hypothetical protein [Desulfuromonadales bacterium]